MRRIAVLLAMTASAVFASEEIVLKKPPESLGKYYPPKSKNFEFLMNMYDMSTSFTGINLNINEGDWKNALRWAKNLRDKYKETAKMVPEWKDYFKPKLADDLVKAVESKDVNRVIKASQKLGQSCRKCHQDNELVVKLVYHYPRFDNVKIEDPVDFMEYPTLKYMKTMTKSLKALKIYLAQGNMERAQEEGTNFIERARQLRSMCSKCHTNKLSEDLVVGKEYEASLDKLENLLSSGKVNKDEIFKTLGSISMSCSKCHNIHIIPAMVQGAFKR